MNETKICNSCEEEKPLDAYYMKSAERRSNMCKRCQIDGKSKKRSSTHKKCKHCGEEKLFSEYQKAGGGKWLQPYCKPCDSERKKKHFRENIEQVKQRSVEYYLRTRVLLSPEQKEESRKSSIAKLKEAAKKYREGIPKISIEEKKRRKSECDKRYRENNKEKLDEKKKAYKATGRATETAKEWQARMMQTPEFRIKKNLRGRVYVALKRGIKTASTMDLLGCTIEHFKKHIESTFKEGMSWDNYNKETWHIDHVRPCRDFNLTDPDQQKICFHWSNMQALWAIDNLKKGAKYAGNRLQEKV